jgi:hypothetical protein
MRTGYRRRSINRWLLLLKLQLLAIIIGLGALCTSDTSSMSAQNDVSRAADTSGTVSDNANVGRAFGGAFGIVPFSPLGSAQNGAAGVASLLNPRPLEINRQNTHDGLSILADAAILSENAGDFTTNTAPQASGGITALLAPGDGAVQASDGGTATPRLGRQLFSVTDIQPPNYRQSAGAPTSTHRQRAGFTDSEITKVNAPTYARYSANSQAAARFLATNSPIVPTPGATDMHQTFASHKYAQDRDSWFKGVLDSKHKSTASVPTVWITGPDGKSCLRSETEHVAWHEGFGNFLEAVHLQGLDKFTDEVIAIGSDGKPRFTGLFELFSLDADKVRADTSLQRLLLQRLHHHCGCSLRHRPSHEEIALLDDAFLRHQFKFFVTVLQSLQGLLTAAAVLPGETVPSMYKDAFGYAGHPLRLLLTLVMIDTHGWTGPDWHGHQDAARPPA